MVTNRNLGLLLEKLFNDKETVERILIANDMHELYVVCLTIQDGYSYEEFEEFFECLVSGCTEDLKYLGEMSPEELDNVSGGRGEFKKTASAALASFLTLTSFSAHGKDASVSVAPDAYQTAISVFADKDLDEGDIVVDGYQVRRKIDRDDKDNAEEKEGWGSWFKRKITGIGKSVYNNKGKIFLVVVALALAAGGIHKMKDIVKDTAEETAKKIEENKKIATSIGNLTKQILANDGNHRFNDEQIKEKRQKLELLKEQSTRVSAEINRSFVDKIKDKLSFGADGKTTTLGQVIIGGGLVLNGANGIIDKVTSLINWGGNISKQTGEISRLVKSAAPYFSFSEFNYEYKKNEQLTLEERLANLEKALELLVGQEEAKKQIIKQACIIANAHKRYEEGIWQKSGINVMVFAGPSGTGKTFAASLLAKSLSNVKPYIITADEILRNMRDAEAMWGRRPSITQVILSAEHKNQDGTVDNFPNSLGAYIREYGDRGMVLIDEFDKLTLNLPREEQKALEEFLRTLMDTGIVKSQYGDSYDLRGMTFILTTNETIASLEGRIEERAGGVYVERYKDAEGNIQYREPIVDKSRSETLVARDGSFAMRFRGRIARFGNLPLEGYIQAVHNYLDDDPTKTKEEVQDEGGTSRATLAERLMWGFDSVKMSDDDYRLIAKFAMNQPNAVRSIVGVGSQAGSVVGNYREALIDKLTAIKSEGGDVEGAKFEAKAYETIDAAGNPVIKFDIKFIGYAGEEEQQQENSKTPEGNKSEDDKNIAENNKVQKENQTPEIQAQGNEKTQENGKDPGEATLVDKNLENEKNIKNLENNDTEQKNTNAHEDNLVKFDPTFAKEYKASDEKNGVLSVNDYDKILRYYLGDNKEITKEDVVKQKGTPCVTVGERLSEGFGTVKISDKSYKLLANYAAKQKNGIDSIVGVDENSDSLVNSYHSALKKKIADLKEQGEDIKNAEFEAIARRKRSNDGHTRIEFELRMLNRVSDKNNAY